MPRKTGAPLWHEKGERRALVGRAAIERAIACATTEDTVVLAGKGHEDYQIVGREKLPFDDRREARRFLADYATAAGGEGNG